MRKVLGAVLAACFLFGCSDNNQKTTLFSKIEEQSSGIDFINTLQPRGDLNIIEYLYFYNGGGVAIADFNNDLLGDIVFTSNQGANTVYFNKGDLTFKKQELPYPLSDQNKWSTGVTTVDINHDGFQDIYICQVGKYKSLAGRNLLYINNGGESFTEEAAKYGLDFEGFSTHSSFFDYDGDGDLDMFLLNHAVHTTRSYKRAESRSDVDSLSGDRLYKNLSVETGEAMFVDVSRQAGIYSSPQGYGLGLAISDINQDGWPDIYVGNDFHENDYLYINQGDGTFKESLESQIQHTSRFTMGVDIADVNQDAFPDIMSLDMLPADEKILMKSGGEDANKVAEIKLNYGYHHQVARNVLQVNNGQGTFSDIALQSGVYATDWSWSTLISDLNNDRMKDIFISNGIYKRPNDLDYINYLSNTNLSLYSDAEQDSIEETLIDRMPTIRIPNYVFKNQGNLEFEDVSAGWGLGDESYSNGTAYADLDNDGDLELIINNVNEKASLYENNAASDKNYLQISLKGDRMNPTAIGSKVILYADGSLDYQELFPVRGFQSSVSPVLHFGLDTLTRADSIIVIWPDKKVSKSYDIASNQRLVFNYEEANDKGSNFLPVKERLEYQLEKLEFTHIEDRFNDYDREKLIPHKVSTQGPALALGDIDQDGNQDFYIGGAHNQGGRIFFGTGDASFRIGNSKVFEEDAAYEDVDAVFFDIDDDKDLDLYVVSGGGYYPERASLLEDRIYLNDGNGNFFRSKMKLPRSNGSVAVSGDFDNDGDQDLFVGSYSIPGSYGVTPTSYFLINNGDLDFTTMPVVLGMVKDALYEDVRNVGKKELLIAGEWMPISLYTYENKGWLNLTDSLKLGNTKGWWNNLTFHETADGKSTVWAGNVGLNSKLKASAKTPVTLYLGDFDNNGQIDPLLFYYKAGVSIPFMSKDELVSQLPALRKDFLSYTEYANVNSITELIKGLPNNRFEKKEAQLLSHTVFEFDESSHIQKPLPAEIQRSFINDIAVKGEYVAYAGNFFGPVSNFGRYDAAGLLIQRGGEIYNINEFKDKQVMEVEWINSDTLLVTLNNSSIYLIRIEA